MFIIKHTTKWDLLFYQPIRLVKWWLNKSQGKLTAQIDELTGVPTWSSRELVSDGIVLGHLIIINWAGPMPPCQHHDSLSKRVDVYGVAHLSLYNFFIGEA